MNRILRRHRLALETVLALRRLLFRAGLSFIVAMTALAQQPIRDDPEWHYRRAREAMEQKDYETAVESWKAITALMPDFPEARSNLGLMYHIQRKYEPAIKEFREALRQNPRLLAAKVFLGIDYYLTSQPELAIGELAGAVSIDPRSAEARKWLAMSQFQTGNLGQAIAEFKECRRLDPSDHELIFHLGRTYRKLSTLPFLAMRGDRFESGWFFLFRAEEFAQQGDPGKALEEFRDAARVEARLPDVHFQIGKLLEAKGEVVEAVHAHVREMRNFPSHLGAAAGLVRLLEQAGMNAEANQIRGLAEELHKGRPAALQALAAAKSPVVRPGPLPEEDSQQIRESLRDLGAAAETSWAEKVRAALLAGEPQEALALARRAGANADNDQTEYWRARAQFDLGQLDEALKNFLALHNGKPANPGFAFYLRKCAKRLSLQSLELFVSLEPNSYRTHQLRAEYHAVRDENEEAIEEYKRALALKPKAPQLHLEIGTLHLTERRYDEAIAAFRAELKNDSFSVPALTRIGEAYSVTGRTSEAQKVLAQAIRISPKSAAAHKALGQVYFKQRDFAKSVEHLQSALEFGIRDDETVHYHLGRVRATPGYEAPTGSEQKWATCSWRKQPTPSGREGTSRLTTSTLRITASWAAIRKACLTFRRLLSTVPWRTMTA